MGSLLIDYFDDWKSFTGLTQYETESINQFSNRVYKQSHSFKWNCEDDKLIASRCQILLGLKSKVVKEEALRSNWTLQDFLLYEDNVKPNIISIPINEKAVHDPPKEMEEDLIQDIEMKIPTNQSELSPVKPILIEFSKKTRKIPHKVEEDQNNLQTLKSDLSEISNQVLEKVSDKVNVNLNVQDPDPDYFQDLHQDWAQYSDHASDSDREMDKEIIKDFDTKEDLKCKECKKTFWTTNELENHIAAEQLKCSECDGSFLCSIILKKHLRDNHEAEVCRYCGEVMKLIERKKHFKQNHKGDTIKCPHCNREFYKGLRYTNHLKHRCEFCNICFTSTKKWLQHSNTHIKKSKKSLSCNICDMTFENTKLLRSHSIIHPKAESTNKDRTCKECNIVFQSRTALMKHNEKTIKCEYCDRTHTCDTAVKKHHLNDHGKEVCRHCGEIIYFSDMKTHFIQNHQNNKVECQHCNKKLFKGLMLESHLEMRCDLCNQCFDCGKDSLTHFRQNHVYGPHLPVNGIPVTCNICDKEFAYYRLLLSHRSIVHSKEQHQFFCHICGKSFNSNSALKTHLITHETNREIKYKFQCEKCKKRFQSQAALNNHMKADHDKIFSFICHLCPKKFTRKSSLTSHLNFVHSNIRNHCCDECDFKSVRKGDLRMHIESVHLKQKNFKCDECGKSFVRKSILNTHIKTFHSTIRDFKCDQCDKAYVTITKLKRHLVEGHSTSTNPCNICGRIISGHGLGNMKLHQTKVHGEYTYKAWRDKMRQNSSE